MNEPGLNQLWALLVLLMIDLVFVAALLILVAILARTKRAAFAVLKRNFLGYFTNPTGYVFLCLFVLLTSMAAFWPHEFFSSNLATLDQLNKWFPIIMLFFIPAITMSIWADERRQGTDELLLTLPANDFDIVIGKYLATASIYTASLLFSQLATFSVLLLLSQGELDTGLFAANYFGYWFIGMAMLAVGMIASFLTSNLTVGFILGALFNAPLAFAAMSDVIIENNSLARFISIFSIREQFDNFGRGVIGLSSVAYFTLLVVFGLYLCMVLIGRRHWSAGKEGNTMFLHYFGRVIMLLAIVLAGTYFFRNNDYFRQDMTKGQVSSLSDTTRRIIRNLETERPIVIEAYLSADVPEQYARTKYDLLARLKEFQSLASSSKAKLDVRINDNLEAFSEEASIASKQYGIEPQTIRVRERGAFVDQKVILGAAFRCGLSKVVVPFFENGVPVEYELVRSIKTVAQPTRKKLGIVKTDAQFMGGFSMAGGGFQQIPRQAIITELSKQYELVEVDPTAPISPDLVDVMMVVQPSALSPQELPNVIAAIKAGVPTAVFEDPVPFGFDPPFPGTGEPKQAPGGMFGGGGPQPKGDIQELWRALGLQVPNKPSPMGGVDPFVVWQPYNPYPKLQRLMQATDEWIFVREELAPDEDLISEASPITAGLQELMFLYAGTVESDKDRDDLSFTKLVRTGPNSGVLEGEDARQSLRGPTGIDLRVKQGSPTGSQCLAIMVEGKSAEQPKDAAADANKDAKKDDDAKKDGESNAPDSAKPIRAVYVTDADCMLSFFLNVRARPDQFDDIRFRFQNVTFVLNIIDVLTGETDYPAIRRHEPQHSTLQLLEKQSEIYRDEEDQEQLKFQETFNSEVQAAEEENQKVIAKFQDRLRALETEGATDVDKRREQIRLAQEFEIQRGMLARKLAIKKKQLEKVRDQGIAESRRKADTEVLNLQNGYKFWAIFLPPIPPLLVGIAVFVSRRVREREGISKNRLR
jgi:ABC-2 type transport system permease protein